MENTIFYFITDTFKKALKMANVSEEEFLSTLKTKDLDEIKSIVTKISKYDIKDSLLINSYITSLMSKDIKVINLPHLLMLSDAIDFDTENSHVYMSNLDIAKDDNFKFTEYEIDTVISTLSDDIFSSTTVDNIAAIYIKDNFLYKLKVRKSIAMVELFKTLLIFENKQKGKDIKSSPYVYNFIEILPNIVQQ